MPRSPDFFRGLTGQLLEQLEEYARQPGRTGDEVHGWVTDQGVTTSRSAVYRWLQDFRLEDRTRRASQVARQYLDAARDADPQAVTEASLRKFEELVFDHLTGVAETDAKELSLLASAMKTGLVGRRELIELKRTGEQALGRLAAEGRRRAITADDIEAVRKAVFG